MNQAAREINRICICGVGGIGGYFGGRLAAAFRNNNEQKREIYFIARGEHLRAIQQHGITVKTPGQIIAGTPILATDDVSRIPAPDLILICTKSYDLKNMVMALKPKINDETVVIPLLNGVDIYERIRSHLNTGIVLPACLYLGTHIESPGVISQSGGDGIIRFGRGPQFPQYDAAAVKRFFSETGIRFEWLDNPYPAIWEKFIFIASFGLVTASSGRSLGEVIENEVLRNQVNGIMQEVASIASKKAIGLSADIIEKSMKKASNFPYDNKTSYQRDVEAWPKPNEGDLYGGYILREAAKLSIPTSVTELLYQRILALETRQ